MSEPAWRWILNNIFGNKDLGKDRYSVEKIERSYHLDHYTPTLLLDMLFSHSNTHTQTHTTYRHQEASLMLYPFCSSLAKSPLLQGPMTDNGIIGLSRPAVRWECLGLDKWCVHVCECYFDPGNAAQWAEKWLMSHRISGCSCLRWWWRGWGIKGVPSGSTLDAFNTPSTASSPLHLT